MPKNVMKLLKPSPHRQRNDFDLSHRHVLDANFGELLPATCIETVPGDNITLHAADLLRNIPFVSSPFLRAKQHLDVWFVPYHDLWHQFDAFITQKSEPVSSAFKGSAYCPYMKIFDLHKSIDTFGYQSDIVGRRLTDRSYYLLQLLGYGAVESKYGTVDASYKVNPFRLAAYNYIWYNEYRQQYYDDGTRLMASPLNQAACLFNFDRLDCSTVAGADALSGVASGQLAAAMCQMRYRCWKKDLFTGLLPSTQFGNVSTLSGGSVTGLTAAFVGQSSPVDFQSSYTKESVAYTGGYIFQNDFTRNDSLATGPDVDPANASGTGRWQHQAAGVSDGSLSLANLNVSNPSHDYVLGEGPDGYPQVIASHDHVITNHRHALGNASTTARGTVNLNSDTGTLSFDVLALRKAEAVQIWRENALRAGNHIKDNMMAHYGVASDFNDHRPTYLGSVSAPLNISDIATTANAGTGINDTVGDIAGKGLSSLSEKVFKFHAKDFGVIMVMLSVLPEAEYDGTGIDRMNQLLEAEDFFVPEYENLGLEAVGAITIASGFEGKPVENTVIGYAPRYYGYKTKLDKVFGSFVGNGIFRTWASQRSDVSDWYSRTVMPSTPLQFMYVNPALFDANFNVGIQNSPQFLCDCYFEVDAVRPMSVTGLPFS